MALKKLTIAPLDIPFKTGFKHHSAERKKTQSVLVKAESKNGAVGWGESCPREYVTGEDVPGCLDFFTRHQSEMASIKDMDSLKEWVKTNESLIDVHPAAWCAMELAMLDMFSKDQSQSIEKTLGIPELAGTFEYTAVLSDSSEEEFRSQVKRYLALGFTDFKIKISGNLDIDKAKINFLLKDGVRDIRIRLDANNLWQDSMDACTYLKSLPFLPFAIEEPLKAFDYVGFKKIAENAIPIKIILDESALVPRHLEALRGSEDTFIVNLRVSKMGGLIRSLDFAEKCRVAGFPLIIGAQVGETSILTRAALVVANVHRANLLAQEGAYGTLLLESDITPYPWMFGKAGKLDPTDFIQTERFGFQIQYIP